MSKYSFFYTIVIALFIPIAHAMEKTEPINPGSFTEAGKAYMVYAVDIWVEAAEKGNITTGLASIFNSIQKKGIDNLIHDSVALEKANKGFYAMVENSVFQTLSNLQKINTFNYGGAKQLQLDVSRVVGQAVAMNVLREFCPDFKVPSKNLIEFFASNGRSGIPYSIDLLKINEQLDISQDASYIRAFTLLMGYLEQIA